MVVPIYNVSRYLEKCIESILAQTYSDIEIILVDDGSTDGSSEICDRYASLDERIKVIHKNANEGLVRARKTGVCEATADLVGYVDGDDWIEPDMYETLYELLTKANADVAVCSRFIESDGNTREERQGIPEGIYDKEKMMADLFPHMIVGEGFFEWGLSPAAWDKLYKKEFLFPSQMNVDDTLMMGEDAALTFPLMTKISRLAVCHKCLYHYRQSEGSMVRTSADSNYESERARFIRLHHSVSESLSAFKESYDFSDQWLKYVLFLMLPRADALYKNMRELGYLFPFKGVKRGERVVVYCAGLYGMRLYRFLKETGFCECIAIADKNAGEYKKQGINVIFPEEIDAYDYDAVVVASSYEKTRNAIVKKLKSRLRTDRIYGIDYAIVSSVDARMAFGIS